MSDCGAVTLAAGSLRRCADLETLVLQRLKRLELRAGFHSGSVRDDGEDDEYGDEEEDGFPRREAKIHFCLF